MKRILANNNEVSRSQTRNKRRRIGKYLWKLFLNSRQMAGMAYMCLTAATRGVTKTSWSADGFESHRAVCTQRDTIRRKMQKSSEEEYKQKRGYRSRTSFPHCHKLYMPQFLTSVIGKDLCSSWFTSLFHYIHIYIYIKYFVCISPILATSHLFLYSFLLLLLTIFLTLFLLTVLLETIYSQGPHRHLSVLQRYNLYLHEYLLGPKTSSKLLRHLPAITCWCRQRPALSHGDKA